MQNNDSLMCVSFSSLLAVGSTRSLDCLMAGWPYSTALKQASDGFDTWHEIWDVLAWSLNAMATGKFPRTDTKAWPFRKQNGHGFHINANTHERTARTCRCLRQYHMCGHLHAFESTRTYTHMSLYVIVYAHMVCTHICIYIHGDLAEHLWRLAREYGNGDECWTSWPKAAKGGCGGLERKPVYRRPPRRSSGQVLVQQRVPVPRIPLLNCRLRSQCKTTHLPITCGGRR